MRAAVTIPQTEQLMNNRRYSSQFGRLEGQGQGSSIFGVRCKPTSWATGAGLLTVTSRVRRGEGALWGPIYKGTNLIPEGPHHLILSHGGRIATYESGGRGASPQTITRGTIVMEIVSVRGCSNVLRAIKSVQSPDKTYRRTARFKPVARAHVQAAHVCVLCSPLLSP